jgi:hypothetical protein
VKLLLDLPSDLAVLSKRILSRGYWTQHLEEPCDLFGRFDFVLASFSYNAQDLGENPSKLIF